MQTAYADMVKAQNNFYKSKHLVTRYGYEPDTAAEFAFDDDAWLAYNQNYFKLRVISN